MQSTSAGAPGTVLASLAASRPDTVVTAAELGRRFGKDGEWVRSRTGIRELRRVVDDADLLEHAVAVSRQATRRAGLTLAELDLVIVATCSANQAPHDSIGDRLLDALRLPLPQITVNAACSGFCYALSTADALIRTGAARTVLVVAAESMSTLIDPDDLGTSIIFGDGVGAAVVRAADGSPGIGPAVFGSDGALADLIAARPGDPRPLLGMAGREVFRWAVDTVPEIAEAACTKAGLALADIDVFVPHQANLRIIDAVTRRLGLAERVAVATDIVESGNTSAASIPLALNRLVERRRVPPGALALLVGFGAGLAYAAQVVRLP